MKRVWYILGGLAVAALLMFVGLMSGMGAVKSLQIADVDLGRVSDGVHEGSFKQGRWSFSVAVTIKDHKIAGVELVSPKDSGSQKLFKSEADRVVAAQSPKVDTVSGATASSKALLKAIENALGK